MKISELDPLISGFTPTLDLVPVVHQGKTYSMRISDFQLSAEGSAFLPTSGGRLSGPLFLYDNPHTGDPMEAATRAYVDAHVSTSGDSLPLTGGQMLGPIHLSREPLDPTEAVTKNYTDTAVQQLAAGGITVMEYTLKTTTAFTDPGVGNMGFNISNQSDATMLFIDQVSAAGKDWTNFFLSLVVGQKISLQSITDHTRVARYTVSGTVLDQGGWTTVPVTPVNAIGFPLANNTHVAIAVMGVNSDQWLPLEGGTLTGPLRIQHPTDANIYVTATGSSWPGIKWDTTTDGTAAGYFQSSRKGKTRWAVEFGSTEAEVTGTNQGTNFYIRPFNDDGSALPIMFGMRRTRMTWIDSQLSIGLNFTQANSNNGLTITPGANANTAVAFSTSGLGGVSFSSALYLKGNPTLPLEAVPMQWVQANFAPASGGGYVQKTGDQMSGGLSFGQRLGLNNNDISAHISLFDGWGGFGITSGQLNVIAGGLRAMSFSGTASADMYVPLIMFRDPLTDMEPVTKRYGVATYAPVTGGTYVAKGGDVMTGLLTLSGDPVAGVSGDLQAVPKRWVVNNYAPIVAGGYVVKSGDLMTGALGLPAGSAIIPSLHFGSAVTGLSGGSNQVVISAIGSAKITVAGTSISFGNALRATDGTAAIPGYSFGSEAATGLYRASPGTLAVSIGGTGTMNWTATAVNVAVPLFLAGDPTLDKHAVPLQFLQASYPTFTQGDARWVNTTGDTMVGMLTIPTTDPTNDGHVTSKYYVDARDAILQQEIQALAETLVFVGQCHVTTDSTQFTVTSGVTPNPGPLPFPSAANKGFYVIVIENGFPPAVGSNIPYEAYVLHDWLICDGTSWVHLKLGLLYFTATQIAVIPSVGGTTNVQATLEWLNANKLDTGTAGTLYLPLSGGQLVGRLHMNNAGIDFDSSVTTSARDTSKHITLWGSTVGNTYGFTVTSSTLNYNAVAGQHDFYSSATLLMRIGAAGFDPQITAMVPFFMGAGSDLTLSRDPTLDMHAATRRWVNTGLASKLDDAPNNPPVAYGRLAGAWAWVAPVVQHPGGALDLNTAVNAFIGLRQITNQTSGANWPPSVDQTALILEGFNSNAGWKSQFFMGGRSRHAGPALFYRATDDSYDAGNGWGPWYRMLGTVNGVLEQELNISRPDGASQLMLRGSTNGVRMNSNNGFFLIEGVDNTGVTTYQPLWLGGSSVALVANSYVASGLSFTLGKDPGSAMEAVTLRYFEANTISQSAGDARWVNVGGDTITGNLTVNGNLDVNTSLVAHNRFSFGENIGAPPPVGGAGYLAWNATQGRGEVDFINAWPVEYGAGFQWRNLKLDGTWVIAMDLTSTGNMSLAGVGIGYGVTGGGNIMAFSWADSGTGNAVRMWVDGSDVGFIASKGFTDGRYLKLSGGIITGTLEVQGHAGFRSGIDFNPNVITGTPTDLSKHIDLYAGVYGFSISNDGAVNHVSAGFHNFYVNTTSVATFTSTRADIKTDLQVNGQATFKGANPQVNIDGPVGTWKTLQFYTGGAARWNIQAEASAEPGGNSNIGSDLLFTRITDAGAYGSIAKFSRETSRFHVYGANSDLIRMDTPQGQPARYFSTVSNIHTWAAGTWTDGNYVVSDENRAVFPLIIDGTSGRVTLNSGLRVPNGGINLVNNIAPGGDPADTSNHLTLWNSGYGLSITGGTMNLVASGVASIAVHGSDVTMLVPTLLSRDPQMDMEAATRRWVVANYAPIAGGGYVQKSGDVMTGNLGMGVAVPAAAKARTIQTEMIILPNSNGGIGANVYVDNVGAGNWKSIAAGAGWMMLNGGTDTWQLQTWYTSTAGATVVPVGRLTFDGRGNLGLGVLAPQAQTTGNGALGGWMFGWGVTLNNLAHNAYYDGSAWRYLTTGTASQIQQAGGVMSFCLDASGTKDAALPMTTRMTLNASGDLNLTGYASLTSGIVYRSFSSNIIGFGWDGTNACINQYIDGTFQGTVATRGWVGGAFKPIGAYTPNQVVDWGSGPTFGSITVSGDTVSHNVYNDGVYGILYRGIWGTGAYWMAFNWDGTNVSTYANGGYACTLVSSTWVSNNFKNIGAYTPNQIVDSGSGPYFGSLNIGGDTVTHNVFCDGSHGIKYRTYSNVFTAFGWNGRVQCWLDGGGAYVELRDTRDPAGPNQNCDVGAGPTFSILWLNSSGVVYSPWNGSAVAIPWDGYGFRAKLDQGDQGYLIRSKDIGGGWVACHQLMLNGNGTCGIWWPDNNFAGWSIVWSDRRLKSNIRPATIDALAQINRLTIHELDLLPPVPGAVSQHWDCALIADEVEEVIPLAVVNYEEGEGYAQIRELPLIATMARAIQQLTARVEQLELEQQQRMH